MSAKEQDAPKVIARPPLILIVTVLAAFVLEYFLPTAFAAMSRGMRFLASGVLLAVGIVFLGGAANEMRRVGTSIPTWEPTTALATGGVFGRSRNPIYVAFFFILLAIGVFFSAGWIFLLAVPFALVIHFGVVMPEERYLTQKFGGEYTHYARRVPRYLVF